MCWSCVLLSGCQHNQNTQFQVRLTAVPDGRTAGGGGLNKGFDEGPHSHIAAGVEGTGSGGGKQQATINKDVRARDNTVA